MIDPSEDRKKLLLPALAIGLLTSAFIIAKTGRDALFFQGGGIFQMPLATLIIAAASVPLAIIFVKTMKSWGARPARMGILLFAASIIGASAPFLQPGGSPLLFAIFIFIPSIFGILFASLWLLAIDIFEHTPKNLAARAFGKLGASSIGGGVLGGFAAKGLAPFIEAKWLVLIGALLLVAVVGLVWAIHRRAPTNIIPKNRVEGKPRSYLAPLSNRYARTLLFIAMTGALAGLLIDMQFYLVATNANLGEKGNVVFFANFYIMLNLSALLLQLFFAAKIQDKIGLRGGLMILPFALAGGATFAAAAATAFSQSALKVTESGLRSSIHRSIWEQAFIPIAATERSFVKLAVDGIGARIAEGLGAAAMFFWMRDAVSDGGNASHLNTEWITWLTLVTVIVWLGITHKLRIHVKVEQAAGQKDSAMKPETECGRLPDQCSCTTEWGKGVA